MKEKATEGYKVHWENHFVDWEKNCIVASYFTYLLIVFFFTELNTLQYRENVFLVSTSSTSRTPSMSSWDAFWRNNWREFPVGIYLL